MNDLQIKRGANIPGFGSVSRIENVFGFWDILWGRYHRSATMRFITAPDGRKAKVICVEHSDPQAPSRTVRAATLLQHFHNNASVPRVLHVTPDCLIVEFISGRPLNSSSVSNEIAAALGQFVATNQPLGDQPPQSPVSVLAEKLEILRAREVLDHDSFAALTQLNAGVAPRTTAPSAICFSDSALKNFVHKPDESLAYVDVFGLSEKLIGLSFVKQALRVPRRVRPTFVNSYVANSEFSEQILRDLGVYCRLHLTDRAVARSHAIKRNTATGTTAYRRRRRRLAVAQAVERLTNCVGLPDETDAYLAWLLRQGRMM